MKQFLKSTAVFACVALLFCACSDDGAEDSVTSADLGLTSIRVINPGAERAWVKWTVPGNGKVAKCELSWTSDVGESGSMMFDAVEGVMETNKDTDLTSLPSGQYNFSVKGISKSGVTSVASTKSEFIYNKETYTQRPIPSLVMMDEYGASIQWSNIPPDCIGVSVNYMNTKGFRADSEVFPISEGTPIVISDAEASTMFTYTTHFRPNDGLANQGLDEMVVANDDSQDYIFPSSAPTAPLSVSVRPGDTRFAAYWIVPYVADIVSSRVEYNNGKDKVTVEVKGTELKKGAANENVLEFTNVPAGDYTVTVYNIKNTGDVSEGTSAKVKVYDQNTYPNGAVVKQDITLSRENEAEIAWDYSGVTEGFEDCVGVIASAARGTLGSTPVGVSATLEDLETLTEVPAWSYISDVQADDIVGYMTYFRPEGGLDYIAVAGSESNDAKRLVPASASPDKPYEVKFIPGDYSIFLQFNITNDNSISKVVVTYENVDDAANSGTIDIEKGNLKFGRDNFTSLTTLDGLKLDAKYDITLWSETSNGTKSAYELGKSVLVYDYAIFQAGCVTPKFTHDFAADYPYGLTMNWDDEVVDYVNFTYVCNTSGDYKTVKIDNLSVPTILADAMPGNAYSYETVCTPAPNAMDSYTMPAQKGEFPYVRVDKSLISQYPMPGDATMYIESEYNNFSCIIDDLFSLATGTGYTATSGALATDYVGKFLTTEGQADKTLTYDLGAQYKLSEFYYTPYYGYVKPGFIETTLAHNSTIKTFSLWGTSAKEPSGNIFYNGVNTDGTPNLENWTLLLDHVAVPDLLNEVYSTQMEYDYNNDGVVGAEDVYEAIQNVGGLRFVIPEENRASVRYVRLQFHTAANETTAQEAIDMDATSKDFRETFLIVEIDHSHMGCDVK